MRLREGDVGKGVAESEVEEFVKGATLWRCRRFESVNSCPHYHNTLLLQKCTTRMMRSNR
jgi:hypothetical protein